MSDPTVIELSRKFVCARLLTYESAEEAAVLKAMLKTRSGELENTVFALLAPDGKTKLCAAGRGPNQSFGRANALRAMCDAMRKAAADYPGNEASRTALPAVPYHPNVRLGLAAAAADIRPLVVVHSADEKSRAAIDPALAKLAWSDEFAGRFGIAHSIDPAELAKFAKLPTEHGVMLVAPNEYGTEATVLSFTPSAKPDELKQMLSDGLAAYRPSDKKWHEVMRAGRRKGIAWKSAIPATDPGPRGQEGRRRR